MRMRALQRRRRILRGMMEPPRWNTGSVSSGAATVWRVGPWMTAALSVSYHLVTPGKYTSTDVTPACVTGLICRTTHTQQHACQWGSLCSCDCCCCCVCCVPAGRFLAATGRPWQRWPHPWGTRTTGGASLARRWRWRGGRGCRSRAGRCSAARSQTARVPGRRRQTATARGASCQCARGRVRRAGRRQPGTTASAAPWRGHGRSHQCQRLQGRGGVGHCVSQCTGGGCNTWQWECVPMNEKPVRPKDMIMGAEAFKCAQSALLSPVHSAPYRWLPANADRVSTKGRASLRRRCQRPSTRRKQ